MKDVKELAFYAWVQQDFLVGELRQLRQLIRRIGKRFQVIWVGYAFRDLDQGTDDLPFRIKIHPQLTDCNTMVRLTEEAAHLGIEEKRRSILEIIFLMVRVELLSDRNIHPFDIGFEIFSLTQAV